VPPDRFSALKNPGLKLDSVKAPVEVRVIDYVEKPSGTDPSMFGGIVSKSVSFASSLFPHQLQPFGCCKV